MAKEKERQKLAEENLHRRREKKGKLLLLTIAGALLAVQLVSIFISGQMVSFALHLILIILMHQGYAWAKYVLASLMVLSVWVGVLGLTGYLPLSMPYPAASYAILAFYAAIAAVLFFSKSVSAYMRSKRNKTKEGARA
ncbi:hypothetical protein [Paenibacillus abyssi]|uniref:Uncharacterized protein n=1 Tax=Paenibacillus abyssi TaxID=1340531 RepID=A0A917CMI3_9BACL|nr:hypothetical protein [Paenibacillus abyssi]GGF92765.1 hypothetical protein GCM10010916_07670 [Paenibacillus abyssi]